MIARTRARQNLLSRFTESWTARTWDWGPSLLNCSANVELLVHWTWKYLVAGSLKLALSGDLFRFPARAPIPLILAE